MNVLFNEISARTLPSNVEKSLGVLGKDILFLKRLSNGRLIYHVGDYQQLVSTFFQGATSLQEVALNLKAETRGLVLALLQSTRQLAVSGALHNENLSGVSVGNLDSYVRIAGRSGIAISLKNGSNWAAWDLKYESANSGAFPDINLSHVGDVPHGFLNYSRTLEDFICAMMMVQGPRGQDDILPNRFYSDFYLKEIDGAFQAEVKTNRLAAFVTVGSAVAHINGYVPRPDVERKNKNGDQLRHIFFNGQLSKFLSIDVAHGCFELCGISGNHLKEINFYGKQLSGPENDHSIRV